MITRAIFLALMLSFAGGAIAQPAAPRAPAVPPQSRNDPDAVAPGPSPQKRGEAGGETTRQKLLADLFARLKEARSPEEGQMLGEAITAMFARSGSPTKDLLLGWAGEELGKGNAGRALDYLEAVIALGPDFAEPYFLRAQLNFATRDYSKALDDLNRVLILEPRHYSAYMAIGIILRDMERPKEALAAFRAALALNPQLEPAKRAVEILARKVEGRQG